MEFPTQAWKSEAVAAPLPRRGTPRALPQPQLVLELVARARCRGVAAYPYNGATVQAALAHSLIVRNGFGTNNQYGGTIYSYGDNDINFNSTDVNGTLTPVAQR